jgi:uracil phosphoribosyltransferase
VSCFFHFIDHDGVGSQKCTSAGKILKARITMSGTSNGKIEDGAGEEDLGPNVHTSSHPVLSHKITLLRSANSNAPTFRAAMREVTFHLGYEATRTLTTKPVEVSVELPDSGGHLETTGQKLVERCALIPVLRSGLGMTDAMQELLPNAASYHIGMYKSSKQSHPVMYYNRLPRQCCSDVAYVLDPIIATASTVMSVVKLLKKVSVPMDEDVLGPSSLR